MWRPLTRRSYLLGSQGSLHASTLLLVAVRYGSMAYSFVPADPLPPDEAMLRTVQSCAVHTDATPVWHRHYQVPSKLIALAQILWR